MRAEDCMEMSDLVSVLTEIKDMLTLICIVLWLMLIFKKMG